MNPGWSIVCSGLGGNIPAPDTIHPADRLSKKNGNMDPTSIWDVVLANDKFKKLNFATLNLQ